MCLMTFWKLFIFKLQMIVIHVYGEQGDVMLYKYSMEKLSQVN